jgi:hypothetical protein
MVQNPGGSVPSRLVGWSAFVFERYSVRISAGKPAVFTAFFRGFPQSLQSSVGIVPQLNHGLFLPNPFEFIIHLTASLMTYKTRSYGKN